MSSGVHVPDLLRRFVSAPHVCNLLIGANHVRLETNDPAIATAMRSAAPSPRKDAEFSYFWKLIRDELAPRGGDEVKELSCGPLSTVLLGAGTVVVIDRQQHEVLGFIAPGISAQDLLAVLLPRITRLSREWHPTPAERSPFR